MNHFDFLNAINQTKENLFVDSIVEKDYSPFMINRGLSYFNDTIMYANEMNRHMNLGKKLHFDFLLNIVPKRKRFSKWFKKEDTTLIVNAIMSYYKYNQERAQEVMSILNDEQIRIIIDKMNKGGRA